MSERTEVLVVGAGQAGIAMSEHLTAQGIDHLVLERGRIAERWRSGRWDSLVANGPAWHDRFPSMSMDAEPDAFVPKEQVADYFVDYATMLGAPVRTGVEVTSVTKVHGSPQFLAETSAGPIECRFVVAATGPFQTPVVPSLIPATAGLSQLHSADYRNPGQLPPGGVLVVGGGASGAQIAAELRESGREVWLSLSAHDRPPRRYRGRDNVWWLGVLGKWDRTTPAEGAEHVTFAVSGAKGGHTVDFRELAATGVTLVGRTESFGDGVIGFAPDLAENIAHGDADYRAFLDEADAYVESNGLDLPPALPEDRRVLPDPPCLTDPLSSLDVAAAGIGSVVWATGYRTDYGWLKVDSFDAAGRPRHQRGVADEPGVYFLGLPWLSRRGSSFIWGVWHDAKYLADQIEIQRTYLAYGSEAR